MRDLRYDLLQLCKAQDSSGGTRRRRKEALLMCADQLAEMGFKNLRAHQLKGKHVLRLVDRWQREGISTGTIKNRLSYLRYWAKRVGREHVMYKDNMLYGIPGRSFDTGSRAQDLLASQLAQLSGPYADRMRCSLKLMRYLGLRREEATRWRPSQAIGRDGDGVIVEARIQRGWGKNGRPRTLPIRHDVQREVMEESARLATAEGSMIPDHLRVEEYMNMLEYRTRLVGLDSKHALRHAYAAERYEEITGTPPPNRKGGDPLAGWDVDDEARQIISAELGHSRKAITNAYLGRQMKRSRQPKDK